MNFIDEEYFGLEVGKIYGVVGTNGSGKSLLLKRILEYYYCSGEIIIIGQNLRSNYSEALRSVSDIVDFVSFYNYLNAYENVRYFAMMYDVHFSRVREVLDLAGLSSKDRKTVCKYSLGMKLRLGLAISFLKNPKILIIDESLNELDNIEILELRKLLVSFKNIIIIVSSCTISNVEKIADEVLVTNNGKIIKQSVNKDNELETIKTINYGGVTEFVLNEEEAIYMKDFRYNDTLNSNNLEPLEVEILKMLDIESDNK